MMEVTIRTAKSSLSELLKRAVHVTPAFFEPLPAAELTGWE